jgi:hypothetical protein
VVTTRYIAYKRREAMAADGQHHPTAEGRLCGAKVSTLVRRVDLDTAFAGKGWVYSALECTAQGMKY